jgi:DNA (cytosine-5)-methyltransferase 1
MKLVLSLFTGAGLLDRGFELEGFCVVSAGDILWGRDVRELHPPPGKFNGIIGGPPCQCFSSLGAINRKRGFKEKFGNLIPEFERVVREAQPDWFVMENVPRAPLPDVAGYKVHAQILDNRWLGEIQRRKRRISFGTKTGARLNIEQVCLDNIFESGAVTSGRSLNSGKIKIQRYTLADAMRLQGLPENFFQHSPFTFESKMKMVANGVPVQMAKKIAQAVKSSF